MTPNVRALCRCGIRIPSARNHCPAFAKDKYLEPMFGDAGQARTTAAILLMLIATTSSRTCTKPIVVRCPAKVIKGKSINENTLPLILFNFCLFVYLSIVYH